MASAAAEARSSPPAPEERGKAGLKRPAPLTLDPVMAKLEHFQLFETVSMMYLVGSDRSESQFRILRMNKRLPVTARTRLADVVREEQMVYSKEDLKATLALVDAGNRETGGLRQTATGFGIVGFVRFVDCFYLMLITQRRKVGEIGGNDVYGVKATELFAIKDVSQEAQEKKSSLQQIWSLVNSKLNPTPKETAESRYVGLFQIVDLTKDFFFSYTYDLTNHLQHNMLASTSKTFPLPPCKEMFKWNHYLTQDLETCVSTLTSCFWILPIVHGAYIQKRCSRFGRIINIILLARRSRHFAGTRYLKRGVSDMGKAANDVEVEQIVHEENGGEGVFSSYVQMRGSIPTFWSQESSMTTPKPPIVLNRVDPTYTATQLHFADLLERYSSPILVVNLVKQKEKREREGIVGKDFKAAIDCLNASMPLEHKIRYCALDFSSISKSRGAVLLKALDDVARWGLDQTGFFCSDMSHATEHEPSSSGGSSMLLLKGSTSTDALSSLDGNDSTASGGSGGGGGRVGWRLPWRSGVRSEQRGVIRTNCIDSLDRTNVAQFMIGMHVLSKQLAAFGITQQGGGGASTLLSDGGQSPVVSVFMDMFTQLGDILALQYGGSETNKRVATEAEQAGGSLNYKHKELLTTMRRYCSNAFTDAAKQDAMNLFLGLFVPSEQDVPLWEMENDYYLHNSRVKDGGLVAQRRYLQMMRDWEDDDEEEAEDRVMQEEEEEDLQAGLDLSSSSGSGASPMAGGEAAPQQKPPSRHSSPSKRAGGGTSLALVMRDPLDPLEEQAVKEEERRRALQVKRRRVRKRCRHQMAELSSWWVEALQRYDQQRMWMQLGPPKQWRIPSRFERLYHPKELTEFDALFAHDFMLPLYLGDDGRRRSMAPQPVAMDPSTDDATSKGDKSITITRFARDFSVKARSILNRLATKTASLGGGMASEPKPFDTPYGAPITRQRSTYVGEGYEGSVSEADLQVFHDHLQPVTHPESVWGVIPPPVDPSVQHQYESLLREVLLEPDDVQAMHDLATQAFCSRQLDVGPYRGLEQDVEIRPLLYFMSWLQDRYERDLPVDPTRVMHTHDWRRKEAELKQSGVYSEGLDKLFRTTLQEAERRRDWYANALDTDSLSSLASPYCDQSSMDLYKCFYDESELRAADPPLSRTTSTTLSPDHAPAPLRRAGHSRSTLSNADTFLAEHARFFSTASSVNSQEDLLRAMSVANLASIDMNATAYGYAVSRPVEVEPGTAYFDDLVQEKQEDFHRKGNHFLRFNRAGAIGAQCLPGRPIMAR